MIGRALKFFAAAAFMAVFAVSAAGSLYPLLGAAAVVIHETAHLAAARAMRVPMRRAFWHGGIGMKFDFSSASYLSEAVVCLSGSFANYLCAAAVFFGGGGKTAADAPLFFMCYSIVIGTVNLMPVSSLDGGAVLRCALMKYTDPDSAYRICSAISRGTVVLFWLFSAVLVLRYDGGMSMMALSLYLLISM